MSNANKGITSTTDAALDAFWETVAQRHPDAETGDLSPLTTFALEIAAQHAVTEWIESNVPTPNGAEDDHE